MSPKQMPLGFHQPSPLSLADPNSLLHKATASAQCGQECAPVFGAYQ